MPHKPFTIQELRDYLGANPSECPTAPWWRHHPKKHMLFGLPGKHYETRAEWTIDWYMLGYRRHFLPPWGEYETLYDYRLVTYRQDWDMANASGNTLLRKAIELLAEEARLEHESEMEKCNV